MQREKKNRRETKLNEHANTLQTQELCDTFFLHVSQVTLCSSSVSHEKFRSNSQRRSLSDWSTNDILEKKETGHFCFCLFVLFCFVFVFALFFRFLIFVRPERDHSHDVSLRFTGFGNTQQVFPPLQLHRLCGGHKRDNLRLIFAAFMVPRSVGRFHSGTKTDCSSLTPARKKAATKV